MPTSPVSPLAVRSDELAISTVWSVRTHDALFAWLISHQPAVLFSQKEQISYQQPASSTFLSEQTSTRHQPPAKRTSRGSRPLTRESEPSRTGASDPFASAAAPPAPTSACRAAPSHDSPAAGSEGPWHAWPPDPPEARARGEAHCCPLSWIASKSAHLTVTGCVANHADGRVFPTSSGVPLYCGQSRIYGACKRQHTNKRCPGQQRQACVSSDARFLLTIGNCCQGAPWTFEAQYHMHAHHLFD
jgi:hypothetical protein